MKKDWRMIRQRLKMWLRSLRTTEFLIANPLWLSFCQPQATLENAGAPPAGIRSSQPRSAKFSVTF